MPPNRRRFLQTLGSGVAMVSLPEFSSILNWFSFPGGPDESLHTTLRSLLLGSSPSGGAFLASADTTLIEGTPQQLLSAPAALLKIFDNLGLERSFSDRVNYKESSQCAPHFKRQEEIWRQRGFDSFTDVKRAAVDSDVAVGIGGRIDSENKLTEAAGATQYQHHTAVPLISHDPTIALATRWLLDSKLSGKELVQSLAIINKQDVSMEGGQTATRYETPVTASVYIPHPRQHSRVNNAVGIVAVNSKRFPDRIYFADIYT